MRYTHLTARDLATAGALTALVCAATSVLKVDIPQTRGYFNIGDSMIYIASLLFGPLIGGLAGGLGSMLADIILGAPWYAPGTLLIKGLEGFIVGYISHKPNPLEKFRKAWRMSTILISMVLAMVIYELGSSFYSVEWQLTPLGIFIGSIYTSPSFWMFIAILLQAFLIYVGVGLDPKIGWYGLAIILGGVEMIIGYFIYQFYILGLGYAALYEVPFNIGQVVVGLTLAIPSVKAIKRAIPTLSFKE